jgi:hypothetical protein
MTKTPWAHLPNAKHIDAVLADVRKRPEAWQVVRSKVPAETTALRGAAQRAAIDTLWRTQRGAEWEALLNTTQKPAHPVAYGTAWFSLIALIAWDSSADLLDCTPDVLRAMVDLAEPPVCHQAALLLPYAFVRMTK